MDDDLILETRGLTKEFKGFVAVKEVNLRVKRRSIHALIGPNGAGKTTVFNLLTKFLDPTSGEILFNGKPITGEKPGQIARRGLVRSFQISAVYPHLPVLENVRIGLMRKLGISFHFWRPGRTLDRLNPRCMEVLESVGLAAYADTIAAELPYGRKRALELAATIALEPELMLLDEPTSGIGHEDVARVTELIKRAAADRTVIMVEHNLSVVADLSDVITVMARGSIIAEGPYSRVSQDPQVIEAYMGVADD